MPGRGLDGRLRYEARVVNCQQPMRHEVSQDEFVSASELAQMGVCERVVRFDALHGRKMTRPRKRSAARGIAEHARFYEESVAAIGARRRKGYCFIATLALGNCDDTDALRAYRDLVLRRSWFGRWLIGTYYRMGPALCLILGRSPRMLSAVAGLVRLLARWVRPVIRRRASGSWKR